ncbi:5-formyltetrahydrofolate cyclo-ligase [Chitinophaga sp. GCM10012297]|uniref:5-formyltetrahydrofolate cyclo-ligase n=1 Tax=Chitinophaga chungangae TaxID=2821488 RepID=A0ABS3YHP6_9BACT|nr:5-formyltetrahydrofolate cyclo-ligase [Chitinophaga chungangae]MBO9154192.1 5-formyltetrahydrofolate cyclo-ligase [Chitinophaga chungangae]
MPLFKKDIRKDYLAKRLAMSETEAERLNAALLGHCRELKLGTPSYIHLFLPIAAKKEVDTFPLAEWLKQQYPGVQLVLSRSYLATGSMQHFRWNDSTRLVHNSYGIPEPESGDPVAPQDIDVVFVPMLAFDKTGQRVGYGKGVYDTFLQQCRPGVKTVGLCLFPPLPEPVADAWRGDMPMDAVVTPGGIFYFKA